MFGRQGGQSVCEEHDAGGTIGAKKASLAAAKQRTAKRLAREVLKRDIGRQSGNGLDEPRRLRNVRPSLCAQSAV
jgi:hypothetical protein